MLTITIHERIKNRRRELELTADEMAEALDVSRSTYYRYESADIEKMPTSILEPLCKILKTTPDYLMGWDKDDLIGTAIGKLLDIKDIELIDMVVEISEMTKEERNKLKTAYEIIKSNIS